MIKKVTILAKNIHIWFWFLSTFSIENIFYTFNGIYSCSFEFSCYNEMADYSFESSSDFSVMVRSEKSFKFEIWFDS